MASLRYEHLTRLLLHHLRWLLLEPLCRPRGHSLRNASVITRPGVQPTKSPRAGRPSPSCCFLDPLAHLRRSVCGETSKLSVSCGQGCQTGWVLCWTDEAAYRTSCWIKTAALNNQMWSLPFKNQHTFFSSISLRLRPLCFTVSLSTAKNILYLHLCEKKSFT